MYLGKMLDSLALANASLPGMTITEDGPAALAPVVLRRVPGAPFARWIFIRVRGFLRRAQFFRARF